MKPLPVIIISMLLTIFAYGQDTAKITAMDSVKRSDGDINNKQAEIEVIRKKLDSYPKLPTTSKTLKDFIPTGWEVLDSVYSDLNSDRVADLSLVLQHKDTVKEMMPDNWEWENRPRILVLLFKNRHKNEFKLALQNNYIIPREGTGKQGGDPFDSLRIENNVIAIGGEMGGEYSFRFQNGDFYLISAWTNGIKSPKERYSSKGIYNYDTFYYYKIDFLKSKAIVEKELMGGESEQKQTEVSLAKRPLIRLRNLKVFDARKIFKGFMK